MDPGAVVLLASGNRGTSWADHFLSFETRLSSCHLSLGGALLRGACHANKGEDCLPEGLITTQGPHELRLISYRTSKCTYYLLD